MRAFTLNDFGAEPTLTEVRAPEPGPRDIRIRVHASSVNGFELSVVSGAFKAWFEYRLPITLGRDYAGVVERVGDAVTRWAVGDEVFGFFFKDVIQDGAWADLVVLPEDMFVARKPARLGFDEAGALPLAGVGAMQAIDGIAPTEGDSVLVVGATGGVGGFAVQLAAARGAEVIATVGAEDEARLRELGAAETIDFTSEDVVAAVRDRYPDGVDALVDLVTPADRFGPLAELVRSGGRVATTTGRPTRMRSPRARSRRRPSGPPPSPRCSAARGARRQRRHPGHDRGDLSTRARQRRDPCSGAERTERSGSQLQARGRSMRRRLGPRVLDARELYHERERTLPGVPVTSTARDPAAAPPHVDQELVVEQVTAHERAVRSGRCATAGLPFADPHGVVLPRAQDQLHPGRGAEDSARLTTPHCTGTPLKACWAPPASSA